MNKFSTSLRYAVVASTISLGAFGVSPAHAVGFSGAYAPANFTLLDVTADGAVDATSAPGSITLFGSNNGSSVPGRTDYTSAAVASGTFSFNWAYLTQDDDPQFDPFSVLINGVATQLSDSGGSLFQSGSFSTSVNLGDTIGWRINTTDNNFGPSQVTIADFSAPEASTTAVPEPFTIIGTCIGGAAALRMRKKLTSKS